MQFLLKGLTGPGRVAQARRHGVFVGMTINYSDEAAEEAMLGEFDDDQVLSNRNADKHDRGVGTLYPDFRSFDCR